MVIEVYVAKVGTNCAIGSLGLGLENKSGEEAKSNKAVDDIAIVVGVGIREKREEKERWEMKKKREG
jgi:hypothetical protein